MRVQDHDDDLSPKQIFRKKLCGCYLSYLHSTVECHDFQLFWRSFCRSICLMPSMRNALPPSQVVWLEGGMPTVPTVAWRMAHHLNGSILYSSGQTKRSSNVSILSNIQKQFYMPTFPTGKTLQRFVSKNICPITMTFWNLRLVKRTHSYSLTKPFLNQMRERFRQLVY